MKTKSNNIKHKVIRDRMIKRIRNGGYNLGGSKKPPFTFNKELWEEGLRIGEGENMTWTPKYWGITKIKDITLIKEEENKRFIRKKEKEEMYSTMSLINEDLTEKQFNRQINTLHQDKSKNQNTHNPDFCEMEWGVEYSLKNKNTEIEDVKHLSVEDLIYEDEYGTEVSGSFNELGEIRF